MKLSICRACGRKQFDFIYAPKFCSRCRSREFKRYNLLDLVIICAVTVAVALAIAKCR